MVMPVFGFPAGQTVEHDGVVVTLTYFNRSSERQKNDGKVTFMIVNLRDETKTVNISLALTYGGDSFRDDFRFKEVVLPRSVVWRSFQSEKVKTATFAMFAVISEGNQLPVNSRLHLAEFQIGEPINPLENE